MNIDRLAQSIDRIVDVHDAADFFVRCMPAKGFDVDSAITASTRVDRLAYAFAAGYASAISALVPEAGTHGFPAALAATENRSARPRDIQTTLTREGSECTITGEKSFVTLGSIAKTLLVVVREKEMQADGRPQLRLAIVAADARGVTREDLPLTAFAPELPHARVTFTATPAKILEGDGYDRYLKPFRTVEDIHVHIALLAWLFAMAMRDEWPQAYVSRTKAALASMTALAARDASSPETHLAVASAIDATRALSNDLPWSIARAKVRDMWERDRPLLLVAEGVRTERLARARASLPPAT